MYTIAIICIHNRSTLYGIARLTHLDAFHILQVVGNSAKSALNAKNIIFVSLGFLLVSGDLMRDHR